MAYSPTAPSIILLELVSLTDEIYSRGILIPKQKHQYLDTFCIIRITNTTLPNYSNKVYDIGMVEFAAMVAFTEEVILKSSSLCWRVHAKSYLYVPHD